MRTVIEVDPARWGPFPRRRVALLSLLALLVSAPVLLGAWAILAAVGAAGLVLAGPMLALLVSAWLWVTRTAQAAGSRRLALVRRDGATSLPGDRLAATSAVVGGVALLAFGLTFLVAAVADLGSGEVTRRAVVGIGLGLLVAPVLWAGLRGRYCMNRLDLGPDGVELRTYRRDVALPWDVITAVSTLERVNLQLHVDDVGWSEELSFAEQSVRPGPDGVVVIAGAMLGSGTGPAAELLDHYLHHPEHRAELADGRVLDRVRDWDR